MKTLPRGAHALLLFVLALCGITSTSSSAADAKESPIKWEPWTDAAFERAKKENRLVLLDLEAVWCHWCHVMDANTYHDPKVVELIQAKYVAIRVDQDARPDLANRYEDYGWPATIIFDANGKELVKRSAYIPPKPMAALLQACIDDPTPGPSVVAAAPLQFGTSAALPEALRTALHAAYLARYDTAKKGWGFSHKYLDWDCMEYTLTLAANGDASAETMAKETLAAQRALIDPVWGGIYQYSTDGDWAHIHFERIMSYNAENLRVYALAAAQFGDPAHLKDAKDTYRFLHDFLRTPEGAFMTSMDADLVKGKHSEDYFKLDDKGRRVQGIPRIDTHVYARENGWVATALTALYGATGDDAHLKNAIRAVEWIQANRALPGGGFRHDEKDVAGPFLGDTLAMGRAFLALYGSTGERPWLTKAEAAAEFIDANFKTLNHAGYATATTAPAPAADGLPPLKPQRDENLQLVRFANLLHQYTGKAAHRTMAETAFRFATAPEIAQRWPTAAVLLAERELNAPALHITVVGKKSDPAALALFRAAAAIPAAYKRLNWYDRTEGPLPNMDVDYPEMPEAAAFVCVNGRCSAPIQKPEELRGKAERMGRK